MKRRTFSVSHQQHGVVDHPGVAEDLQRVRNTLPVELQFDKGNKNVLTTVSRMSESGESVITGGDDDDDNDDKKQTCMAKALRATETGPFSASQAAISAMKAHNKTFFIKTLDLTNQYTRKKKPQQPFKCHFDFPCVSSTHSPFSSCGSSTEELM